MTGFTELKDTETYEITGGINILNVIPFIPTIYEAAKNIYYGFKDATNGRWFCISLSYWFLSLIYNHIIFRRNKISTEYNV